MPIEPRPHFWNVDLTWLFYALSLLASALFAHGILRLLRRWRSGWRVRGSSASGEWMSDVLAGAGIGRGDRTAGVAHFFASWGFVVLFLGTVLLTIDHHVVSFLTGRTWLVYSLVLDLFGAAFILAIAWLLLRRHLFRRLSMHRQEPEDTLLLVLLLGIAVSGFLTEALRLAATTPAAGPWSPVGFALARALPDDALAAHRALWWLHALLSVLLVAWLPFGKLRHVLTSPLHRLQAERTPVMRTVEERENASVAFGAHELLALDACTRCNRCENVCPSASVAELLSPRRVIAELERASRSGLAASERTSASPGETPWLCTSCGACRAACPIQIDGNDLIRETRGYVVEEGVHVPEALARALEGIAKHGNPWQGRRSRRASWADGLALEEASRGARAEVLWLPGCTLAYDTRCQHVARATAKLFDAGGDEVVIGGEREVCSGDLARRCGEDGLFEMMLEENLALFAETGASTVVVSSPHDWHALAFEAPRLLARMPEVASPLPRVLHVFEVLAQRVAAGRVAFGNGAARRIAFHDPCYLGRHHGLFDPPRQVLRALPGVTLVEMEDHHASSRCCGGGGGRMWFEPEASGTMKMSERRARQAAEAGADTLATGCPWCLIQLEDALKTAGLEGELRVADVTELAAEGLRT